VKADNPSSRSAMSRPPQRSVERPVETLEEDHEIVRRVLGGNRDAYATLVVRHQEPLFRFALGMLGSADAASDIVQDSFVKAYSSLDRCRDPRRFGAWVHRIVRNRCVDHLKSARRRLSTDDLLGLVDERPGAEDSVYRDEVRRALVLALRTLPDAQREAFLMKHLQDCSYDEMSEVLGASISALKMRVKRAREALQGVLIDRLAV
jgi:RNA polymerase sigma-70 factor, ECF subfamily